MRFSLILPMWDISEVVTRSCSVKKVLLKISQNVQESTCARVSFIIKLQARTAAILLKRDSEVFSCEFYENLNNTFFYTTPLVAASDICMTLQDVPISSFEINPE